MQILAVRRAFRLCVALCLPLALHAQENVTTLGIQFRPMVPSGYFGSGEEVWQNDSMQVGLAPRYGHNFGFVIRKGLTRMWSLETGIAMVQRNYRMEVSHVWNPTVQRLDYRLVGYEIPLQALVYVQLSDHIWMNASGGLSLDLYPSNVESFGDVRQDSIVFDYYQKTWRRNWLQGALLANYGFEWRTADKGYWYVGASYHRPFGPIADAVAQISRNGSTRKLEVPVTGNYLTLDLRYFFHEDPEKKRKTTSK